jgi:error-prone DNA polymerase
MGLMQVKGLTEDTAQQIVTARARFPFTSLANFWSRTSVNRDVVENLIAVGAFDSLGTNRRRLLWQLEEVVQTVPRQSDPRQPLRGWEMDSALPDLPSLTELDVAGLDFTLQGASARYSVMAFYRRSLARLRVLSIGQLPTRPPGTLVRTAGIVISRQQPPTAKGMTFLVLEDEEGELPVAIYPNVFRQYRQIINGSASLVVEGSIQRERYVTSLMARRLWRLNDIAELDSKPLPSEARQPRLTDSFPNASGKAGR